MRQLLSTIALTTIMAISTTPAVLAQTEGASRLRQTLSGSVEVPGASIYYEKRGNGPTLLLLPGGPQDTGVFAALASELSNRFTVIAIDPRCNSRSSCEDRTRDLNVDQHADDAAAVIDVLADGPVFVFGTSGGAQVGLNLAARHPTLVRVLIAHEPPSMMLMNDPSSPLAAAEALHETYLRDGVEAAIAHFFAENGLDTAEDVVVPPESEMSTEDRETFDRVGGNFDYWLGHGMLPLSQYRPDVETLRTGTVPIVVALGEGSTGQPIHDMGMALATSVKSQPALFPGDHMGFEIDPEGFAKALERTLNDHAGSL